MSNDSLCLFCFNKKPAKDKPCPYCGNYGTPMPAKNCLYPGTLINNRYIVGPALGVGGFGITYKCWDTKNNGICAVKEYFPSSLAMREPGTTRVTVSDRNQERFLRIRKRFVEEAELLKNFNHPNVIKIYNSFLQNDTAYYVMEYCDGIDLRRYTNNFSRQLGYDEGMNLLFQIMNGMEHIHKSGILHRDIAPDNIFVTKGNFVKILDFGSARREMDQYNRELSVIVKVGYAPIEQYGGRGKQGAYTDIYALGATFYHLFTSKIPIESTQRVANDTLVPFSQLRPDLPDPLKRCIERCMALTPTQRFATIAEMRAALGISNTPRKPQPAPKAPTQAQKQQYGSNGSMQGQQFGGNLQQPGLSGRSSGRLSYAQGGRADIGSRIGAYLLDNVLWGMLFFGMLVGISVTGADVWGFSLLFPFVAAALSASAELIAGTTPGKAMLRMYVCARSGERAVPGQIILRNLIKLLNVFVLVFSKNGQLLEDIATDTVVCIEK